MLSLHLSLPGLVQPGSCYIYLNSLEIERSTGTWFTSELVQLESYCIAHQLVQLDPWYRGHLVLGLLQLVQPESYFIYLSSLTIERSTGT